ncbi:MAG: MBL fold metallo-hydrolase, partial [Myxococcota bacterium]
VSIGKNGTLIVDDQFPELMPRIEAAIAKVGGEGVDFAINTHWHFDHADGNLAFGPAGTWLVSQSHSREKMAVANTINMGIAKFRQPAYPPEALPVITFDDRMSFHWNGERIDLFHAGPAHTAGDAAVFFRGQNAVHMGDVFNNAGYPFIDADQGGDIDGMIAFCKAVVSELAPDAIVIPGHGPVTDTDTLKRYIGMLETVRERIHGMIVAGLSVEEVIAKKPTVDFDPIFGDVALSLGFIDRVYVSLQKKRP